MRLQHPTGRVGPQHEYDCRRIEVGHLHGLQQKRDGGVEVAQVSQALAGRAHLSRSPYATDEVIQPAKP